MDLVVLVAVELITFQTDPSELLVVYFGSSRVDAIIDFGMDLQTLGGTRGGDEVDDHLEADERLSSSSELSTIPCYNQRHAKYLALSPTNRSIKTCPQSTIGIVQTNAGRALSAECNDGAPLSALIVFIQAGQAVAVHVEGKERPSACVIEVQPDCTVRTRSQCATNPAAAIAQHKLPRFDPNFSRLGEMDGA